LASLTETFMGDLSLFTCNREYGPLDGPYQDDARRVGLALSIQDLNNRGVLMRPAWLRQAPSGP
jgi:hypothetical protein